MQSDFETIDLQIIGDALNFNPHDAAFEELRAKLDQQAEADAAELSLRREKLIQFQSKKIEIEREIEAYEAFDMEAVNFSFELKNRGHKAVLEAAEVCRMMFDFALQERRKAEAKLKAYSWYQHLTSAFIEQEKITNQKIQKVTELEEKIINNERKATEILNEINRQKKSIADYLNVDIDSLKKELIKANAEENYLEEDLKQLIARQELKNAELTAEFKRVKALKDKIEEEISIPLEKFRNLSISQERLVLDIRTAERYDAELTNARDDYERRLIHEKTEREFSTGSPRKVIALKRRELDSVRRNSSKLRERIESLVRNASRVTKNIYIDGNNLCYETDKFIGLDALASVSNRLSTNYSVTVIFDASITHMLRINDQEIKKRLGSKITIHIMAAGGKADETLLDFASGDDSYVLSNDRFIDFPEKSVVSNNRLIRHEILNRTVLVRDLKISESY